jgi:hypothetical protein
MVTDAQANWLVEGKTRTAKIVSASDHAPMVLTVQKKNIEIKCAELSATNVTSGTTVEGEVEYKNCISISPIGSGKTESHCKPVEPVMASFKAKVFVHNSRNYLLFEPKTTGGKFATIAFTELCALTETSEVKGSLASECGHLNENAFEGFSCSVEEPSGLLQPNEALFTEDRLKFGANQATLSGVARLQESVIEVQEGGKELTANETVEAAASSSIALTWPSKNIEIQCTTLASSGLKLLAKTATGEGAIKFSGCKTFSPIGSGTEIKSCKPAEPIVASGKGSVTLHAGHNYLLFEPATGSSKFATMTFSESCALFETLAISGSLVAECGDLEPIGTWRFLDCINSEVSHLFRPASTSLFPSDTLLFGASQLTLTGEASAKLSGALIGKTWAGHV